MSEVEYVFSLSQGLITCNVVLGDTDYQVPILPIPGSRIVVSSSNSLCYASMYH